MLRLITSKKVSNTQAKEIFAKLWLHPERDPEELRGELGFEQVTDTGAIEAAIDALMAANPDQVEKARANPRLAGWFTGQVLKATGGKANPAVVGQMVAQKLGL